jgi:hypothetical protein
MGAGLRIIRVAVAAWLISFAACRHPVSVAQEVEAKQGHGESENPHVWRPQTRSVAVFKNGLGFFMREGNVQLRDGWCLAGQVPPAAFGTLAIYALDDRQAVDIVGSGPGEIVQFDDRDTAADIHSKRGRLEASQGLKVELTYEHKGRQRTAAGTLLSIGPQFVALEDDQNNYAVPIAGITRLQVLELPLRIHVAGDAPLPAKPQPLGMAYLRKGITWIPDYTLKVLDDETAELTLRGTLINEAEDLIHTDVHLVVGVPHFIHTDYLAPIAVGQTIRTIGSALSVQQIPQQVTSQIMNRAAIVRNTAPVDSRPETVEVAVPDRDTAIDQTLAGLPQMGGAAATDYTVYTQEDLTLRRGEKAILTLFTRRIKYSHIYHWDLPQRMSHSLLLHNATDTAWTTGPCLALSEHRPLSEDLLKYTPKGAKGQLPVTAAINVAHGKSERETDRKMKAHHVPNHVYFDLVTLEGELTLHNFDKRAVKIEVTNPVPGKPLSASDNGRLQADPTKLKLEERQGTIRWTIELQPGQKQTLSYQYERYVRSA